MFAGRVKHWHSYPKPKRDWRIIRMTSIVWLQKKKHWSYYPNIIKHGNYSIVIIIWYFEIIWKNYYKSDINRIRFRYLMCISWNPSPFRILNSYPPKPLKKNTKPLVRLLTSSLGNKIRSKTSNHPPLPQ